MFLKSKFFFNFWLQQGKLCGGRRHPDEENMIHTLKTLYENQQRRNPELLENFERLEAYCLEGESGPGMMFLNFGFNSLKWFVHGTRFDIPPGELQNVFHNILAEAAAYRGEYALYESIKKFRNAKPYINKIPKTDFDINDWPIIDVSGKRVLINMTTQNIINYVFRDHLADVILQKSEATNMAKIAFNTREETPDDFDIAGMYQDLSDRDEPWRATSDTLSCGSLREPEAKTSIPIEEMIDLLVKHRKK